MANSAAETVIGAVVLVAATAFATYALRSSGLGAAGDSYSLNASFRSVEGISVGTDVRLAGIKVGAVTDLELDPASYQARATFTVREGLEIPEDFGREDRLRGPSRRGLSRDRPWRVGVHAGRGRRGAQHPGVGEFAEPSHALRDRTVTLFVPILVAAGLSVAQPVSAQSLQIGGDQVTREMPVVRLRGLDTLNGQTEDIVLEVNTTTQFGHLEISADSCRVPADAPDADAYAFLRIRDVREAEPRFSGWMFASSPALSSLDHPRYDVWVLSCSNR